MGEIEFVENHQKVHLARLFSNNFQLNLMSTNGISYYVT